MVEIICDNEKCDWKLMECITEENKANRVMK